MLRSWISPIAIAVSLALPATAFAATSTIRVSPAVIAVPAVAHSLVAAPAGRAKSGPMAHAVVAPQQGAPGRVKRTVRPKPLELSPAPPRETKAERNRAAYVAALDRNAAAMDPTERIQAELDRHEAALYRIETERLDLNLERQQMAQDRWQAAFERSPEIRFQHDRGE